MSDRVLVPLPDGRWLALDRAAFDAALEAGHSLTVPTARAAPDEPLLTSQELAAALKKPRSWVEARARTGEIPAKKIGRDWRFRLREVEASIANGART